jgi:folate-dependent phosphoribosylglycinamide formyltransferase PurN
MGTLRRFASILRNGRFWKPGHASCLVQQVYQRTRNASHGWTDEDHLRAAMEWLARAQDVTGDGGVCGRYNLTRGWSTSYPETTGYIIPTFLKAAEHLKAPEYVDRAGKCIEFLLPLQLENGAYPGGEIHENRNEPSPFNTAQIINGLIAWHARTGDARTLESMKRAGDWLVSVQDDDGAWRRHFYLGLPAAYAAHAACWLAELGKHLGEPRYLRAAENNIRWVLQHHNRDNGWIDNCTFMEEDHRDRRGVTHAIAYTYWGILMTSDITGNGEGVELVRNAMEHVLKRLEVSGKLPGFLNHQWRGDVDWACLTGNSQFALIWLRLFELTHDGRFLNGAFKAIDLVKRAQFMDSSNPGLRGGIAGSDPIWGGYISMSVPNWPAKFHADSLMQKREALAKISDRPLGRLQRPADLAACRSDAPRPPATGRPSVIVYTLPTSPKLDQYTKTWTDWDFRPDAVVFHQEREQPAGVRIRNRVREDGSSWIWSKLARNTPQEPSRAPTEGIVRAREYCARNSIPVIEVGPMNSAETIEAVKKLKPDLAIYAGGGILNKQLLAVPTLGTLNVHMGMLPHYRGMNVAEWAAFNGDAVGVTVHWMDPGIDTGDIICVKPLEGGPWRSIEELRAKADALQIVSLGAVVKAVLSNIPLPRRKQSKEEGLQYYVMHPDLRAVLTREMSANINRQKIDS